jgi:uncharacterized protein (DUF58 family)
VTAATPMATASSITAAPKADALITPEPPRRIRLTWALFYFSGVLLFVLLGAINYQSNSAYIVLSMMLATAIAGSVHAWRMMGALRVSAVSISPTFAHEPIPLTVRVTGHGHYSFTAEFPAFLPIEHGCTQHFVKANDTCMLSLTIPGQSRGFHTLPPLQFGSYFPLGLLLLSKIYPLNTSYVVYPQPLFGGVMASDDGDGEHMGQLIGATGDFHGHRAYIPGESQRRIDWRAVARERPFLVKEFVRGTTVDCIIDFAHFSGYGAETRLSLMAGLIISAEREGRRYGIKIDTVHIPADLGEAHYHRCLSALAAWKASA